MFKFLNQPYPRIDDFKHHLKVGFFVGLFIIAFLIIFKPFGLSYTNTQDTNLIIAGYGLVTFFILVIISRIIKGVNPSSKNETNWTTGKEMLEQLFYVFIIGLGNLIYTHFAFDVKISISSLLSFQLFTLIIAIFPVTFLVLLKQIKLLKMNKLEAEEITKQIPIVIPPSNGNLITLISENEKELLEVNADSLLLIESADNYCTVYFIENDKLKSKMLRSTLKRLESQLMSFPKVMRCHRTYIVNLLKVKSVTGNAQGYRLRLEQLDQTIPVSRSLNSAIKKKLNQPV
jgi:DNA-binding LytR/AlgR family response regulator